MQPAPEEADTNRYQQVAIGALAGVLLLLGLYTLQGFLASLAWAAILAIALWPALCRARRGAGGRPSIVISAGFTLAVAMLFVVPLALVGVQLGREAHAASDWLRDAQANGIPEPEILQHLPVPHAALDEWWRQNLSNPGGAHALLQRTTHGHAVDYGRSIGEQAVRRLTVFVFTLLTLFFLFREGEAVVQQMRRAASRAFGPGGERVGRQVIASVRGTVSGLVLVGFGEGVVLGIVYALCGVPHPTVLGAVTAVAAMVPFAAPLAFGAAGLMLAAQGSVVAASLVIGAGFAVTFVADHFVRPVLIGGATRLPFLWVLLGILGGVETWGLLGLFLGPAIMAALILLWREWTGASEPETGRPA